MKMWNMHDVTVLPSIPIPPPALRILIHVYQYAPHYTIWTDDKLATDVKNVLKYPIFVRPVNCLTTKCQI
jgi:hypothetical protein